MSHNSTTRVDQKEYLKKYLSGEKSKKRKKKKDKNKKKRESESRIRIIDDDVSAFRDSENSYDEMLLYGEDAPQIVGDLIEAKTNGDSKSKWRGIAQKKDEIEKQNADETLSEKKFFIRGQYEKQEMKVKRLPTSETSPEIRRKNSRNLNLESEECILDVGDRKRKGKETDNYTSKRRQRKELADLSPPRHRKNGSSPLPQRGISAEYKDLSPPRKKKLNMSPRQHTPVDRQEKVKKGSLSSRKRISPIEHNRSRNQSRKSIEQSNNSNRNDKGENYRQKPKLPLELRTSISNKIPDDSPLRSQKAYLDLSQKSHLFSPSSRPQRSRISPNLSPPHKNKSSTVKHSTLRKMARDSPVASHYPRHHSNTSSKFSFEHSHLGTALALGHSSRSHSMERPSSHKNPFADKKLSQDNEFRSPRRRQMISPPRKQNEFKRKPSPGRENNHREIESNKNLSAYTFSPHRRQRSPKQENRLSSPTLPSKTTIHWETAAMVAKRKALISTSSISPPPTHKLKATKTLDRKKAGLQDANALKAETAELRKDEEKIFAKMPSEMTGRDAEVKIRSTGRRGKRARDAEAEDAETRHRKEEMEQQRKEQYERWGKGLKQVEDHRERIAEQEYESNKPLARYADDEDLDRHLRERERAEDPMLDYMRRKKRESDNKTNSKVHVYEGSYPENRFGIRPGHRWDGVDRSNGYEKKWFEVQNEKRAKQEKAYKYSVEDM